jgi:hypothetical protein
MTLEEYLEQIETRWLEEIEAQNNPDFFDEANLFDELEV